MQGHPHVLAFVRRLAILIEEKIEKTYGFVMCDVRQKFGQHLRSK